MTNQTKHTKGEKMDTEITVWKLEIADIVNPCFYYSLKELVESLEDMAEGMEDGDRITITQEKMMESEFEALPEWEP